MKKQKENQQYIVILSFVVLGFSLVFGGCSTTKDISYSGFMEDYSDLRPDPDFDGLMVSQADDKTLMKYNKFIIEPVSFYLSSNTDLGAKDIDPEVIFKATTYLHDALINDLSPDYPVVDKPGVDVARLRFAITAVELNRKDMGLVNYIPVGLILTGIGEATGTRDRMVVLNMEGEIFDSVTGRELVRLVQRKGIESPARSIEEIKEQDMYPVLDFWAARLRKGLERLHGVK